jgi:hypothetical protein
MTGVDENGNFKHPRQHPKGMAQVKEQAGSLYEILDEKVDIADSNVEYGGDAD